MPTSEKSSLQALLQGSSIPDLPPFNKGWTLKEYNDAQDNWKRKLQNYLRQLLQVLTGPNIVNEIIQQTDGFGEYLGDFGFNMEVWLEFPWPESENPLYGDGASYNGGDFTASPRFIPTTEKPFWTGVCPLLQIDVNRTFAIPYFQSFESGSWMCARFTGFLIPRYSETYTLTLRTDDGVKVWVNDVLIIDDWTYGTERTNTGTFVGVAGQKAKIKIEWFTLEAPGLVYCKWESSSQAIEVIPYHHVSRK